MSATSYQYEALDSAGATRRGTVLASDEHDAYRRVVGAGLTPVSMKLEASRRAARGAGRVRHEEVVALTRELSVLVEAKIPLDRGLLSMAENDAGTATGRMIRDLAAMVESGKPFTSALEKYVNVFGEVYIETVRAGEKSGNLQAVMNHLADLLERQMETRKQIRRALAYPAIVLCVVAVAVTVIVVFVVPKFAATFASQGTELPAATRFIQAVGFSARAYWYLYLGAIGAGVVGGAVLWTRAWGRTLYERMFLRLPYIKRIVISAAAARFARVMSIALGSGLDLVEAVRVGGRATGRPLFEAECERMGERLRGGEALADVLKGTPYIPGFARRMLGAGKDSAELSRACDIVARHYDRETSDLTKNINTIVEPIMTVAMAGIVLLVALAVFLPMWKMAGLQR